MAKISFSMIFLLIAFQAISCYVEPEPDLPEHKSMDIKIFGRKIKLNILEIKGNFGPKGEQMLETLTDKFALKRRRRSADKSDGDSGGSDNSMMGSAQKVFNQGRKIMKNMADQAAKAGKTAIDTMKNTFTG